MLKSRTISSLKTLERGDFAPYFGHLIPIKSITFREGFAPLTRWPVALPLDPAGGSAPRPPL